MEGDSGGHNQYAMSIKFGGFLGWVEDRRVVCRDWSRGRKERGRWIGRGGEK